MEKEGLAEFLDSFDESCYPINFLEDYEILECFSRNPVGETYLVRDRQSGELCVAKSYPAWPCFSKTSEGELLKNLYHPGLPLYITEYQNEEMLFVVRSFVKGQSVNKLVKQKDISREDCYQIARQLGDILIYLHQQAPPVIHRDIKPQNIIVDEANQVSLIDFGISRVFDENAKKDTFFLGTSDYAAPEQYGFSQTDNRSDIYSYGVFLCWLFAGTEDVQQALKTLKDPHLQRLIKKCTAFDPKNRYQSMQQVKKDLDVKAAISRRTFLLVFVSLSFVLAVFFVFQSTLTGGVRFKEPLIEEAVRLALNKSDEEILTEQDLLLVEEIFVFGDNPAADSKDFNVFAERFVDGGGGIQRGTITDLGDLKKLKNLRNISLVYQNISDLSPLSGLINLENLDLHHNPIEDVGPLANVSSLSALCLFDTNVSDLSALKSSKTLTVLDVGDTQVRSMQSFTTLESLRVILLRKAPLESLDQIESLVHLEEIYLSQTQVKDLSPLLSLPNLKLVEVDESMLQYAEKIKSQAGFTLNIE